MAPDQIEDAIEFAREYLENAREGDYWIDMKPLARKAFNDAVERGERPSMWAIRHVAKLLPRERKRGPDPLNNEARNIWITLAVDEVLDTFPDVTPYRNREAESASAGAIVVEALARLDVYMTVSNVEEIWRARRPKN